MRERGGGTAVAAVQGQQMLDLRQAKISVAGRGETLSSRGPSNTRTATAEGVALGCIRVSAAHNARQRTCAAARAASLGPSRRQHRRKPNSGVGGLGEWPDVRSTGMCVLPNISTALCARRAIKSTIAAATPRLLLAGQRKA